MVNKETLLTGVRFPLPHDYNLQLDPGFLAFS